MIDYLYFEGEIEKHPRSQEIFRRFPKASKVTCENYKEVFNPAGQNFRLQKKKPGLILAKQRNRFLHEIPESYGIGGKRNFYFSHILNCPYDCRYCFLQGMYSSAHFVLFVNYEDFWEDIKRKTNDKPDSITWFFSGYDCDSLALESWTGFLAFFLPKFEKNPNAWLELRTKSVNVKALEKSSPLQNLVIAFSFTPQEISSQVENGVPTVLARKKAMHKLAKMGWKVGIRIDPVIDCENFEDRYSSLFNDLLKDLPMDSLHSVSLGAFRMPINFFRKIEKLYPTEPLFAGKIAKSNSSISYEPEVEKKRLQTCRDLLLNKIPESKLFQCEVSPKS